MLTNAARKAVTRAMALEIQSQTLPGDVVVGRDVYGIENVTSGGHNYYGEGTAFTGPVSVGHGTTINPQCELGGPLTIGNYCQLAPRCAVLTEDHPTTHAAIYTNERLFAGRLNAYSETAAVTIGHGAWLGFGAIVVKGVEIGNGAVIGAGSVVTRDVAPYAIAVGNPARVVRARFDDGAAELVERSRWWELTPEALEPFLPFFTTDLASASQPERARLRALADEIRSISR